MIKAVFFKTAFFMELVKKNCIAFELTLIIFTTLIHEVNAEVVKLVDALRSGRSTRKGVGVRIPPSAHTDIVCFAPSDSGDFYYP